MKKTTIKKIIVNDKTLTLKVFERGPYHYGNSDSGSITLRSGKEILWNCQTQGTIEMMIDELHYIALCVRKGKRPHKPSFLENVADFKIHENNKETLRAIERRIKRCPWKNPYGYIYEVKGKKGWYVGQTIRCVDAKDGRFLRYRNGFTNTMHNKKVGSQEQEMFGELRIIDFAYSAEELNWLEYYHMIRRDSILNGYNCYPNTFPIFDKELNYKQEEFLLQ